MAFLVDAFRGPSSKLSSVDAPSTGKKRRRVGKGGTVKTPLRGPNIPGRVVSTGRSPENTDSMTKRFEKSSRVLRNRKLGRETRP
jgi:hypothetical protein